ncbi:hypothetical protein [Pseudobacteroides cellulosolvens]|uniref:Uncharacterized protein n=1 Tax=Pseudobacteroides cellulosolvens ATCC 35603 = DSM 2933 TaxID=398512 RepID=A0A0L6JUS1_9FIRM|nr:hypothetical protein [Pseudobacteroides cellulosolvens]KNY29573.1 hypothetical protein Bccel_4847 [Pseudobacteroides cellulosolvens ATCC 35603 = DSM 2933]
MLDTKLIFIEGISGSGKSTITDFISNLLTQHNIDHNTYFEWAENHPICGEDDVWLNEDKQSSLYRYRQLNYAKWQEHITNLVNSDNISIFDSSLMQTPLNAFILLLNENFKTIRYFYKRLYKIFHICNPYLIYLRQNDVYLTISRVYNSRPREWGDFVIKYICNSPYGKEKCLKGFDGMVKYFSERQTIEDRLFLTYPYKKLQIDNSDFDFEKCEDKVREFLYL